MNSPVWAVIWVASGAAALIAAIWATRGGGRRALLLGRIALGTLFVVGGALVHVINLATGSGYGTFADPSHFWWVSHAWRSVVVPTQELFISLLAAFELAVGVLIVSGGRRTQIGLAAAIAFHLALWLFGWIETIWCVIVLPPLVVLLLAERRSERAIGARDRIPRSPETTKLAA